MVSEDHSQLFSSPVEQLAWPPPLPLVSFWPNKGTLGRCCFKMNVMSTNSHLVSYEAQTPYQIKGNNAWKCFVRLDKIAASKNRTYRNASPRTKNSHEYNMVAFISYYINNIQIYLLSFTGLILMKRAKVVNFVKRSGFLDVYCERQSANCSITMTN